jgi:glycosyltransferase involved in cell wall biosynthesis
MTEVLGDAGVYFDPECPEDIASALNQLIQSPEARARAARAAFDRCTAYSWDRCANETFDYLRKTAESYAVNAATAELV